MNGQTGAELAEAGLGKGWWNTAQKDGNDKRVRKYFAESVFPKSWGSGMKRLRVEYELQAP